MSTIMMWLLFAVVVILIVFGSVMYKRKFTVRELAMIGVMAALSLIAYDFFRIPFMGGSSFHLGNTFTALTALLLDGVSGGLAGAIGLALADILAGDPGYAVTTFILKFIIGIVCGAVAHKAFKLKTLNPKENKGAYLAKVIVSAASGLLVNVITDPFIGYFRNVFIFGQDYTVAQALSKIAGGVTFVNSLVSTLCAVILYLALRPALEKAKLIGKDSEKSKHKSPAPETLRCGRFFIGHVPVRQIQPVFTDISVRSLTTLYCPTVFWVAKIWRLMLVRQILSSSIRSSVPTPLRASASAVNPPTPPIPKIATRAPLKRSVPSCPKRSSVRENWFSISITSFCLKYILVKWVL